VTSISGSASEKAPQTNASVRELALSYRMIPEILPYESIRFTGAPPGMYEPDWTNFLAYTNSPYLPADWQWRSNNWRIARTYQTNLCDVRLIFRWPLLSGANAGNRRQVYRTTVGGQLLYTNDYTVTQIPLYFFQSRSYVRAALP
jgi:hypothetical protein